MLLKSNKLRTFIITNIQQPTANSQQPTANSQQPTANADKYHFCFKKVKVKENFSGIVLVQNPL